MFVLNFFDIVPDLRTLMQFEFVLILDFSKGLSQIDGK